jgi:hypothetical protein
MSKKHSKNLQKVQDMLDGKGTGKIQSGYMPTEETHKVGDIWTDSDGKKWEQKDGYRVNISKLANAGIADQCSDCNKYIVAGWDKDIYRWNGRCYYCQIDFEAELKGTGKFDEWKMAQDKRIKEEYVKKFEEDHAELVKEIEKLDNPFDMKVANAIANGNVDMTIKKNKS